MIRIKLIYDPHDRHLLCRQPANTMQPAYIIVGLREGGGGEAHLKY